MTQDLAQSRTHLALRHRPSGKLLRLKLNNDWEDGSRCEAYLGFDEAWPLFEPESLDQAADILSFDVAYYNATPDRPTLVDGIERKDLEIVELTVTTTIKPLEAPSRLVVEVANVRDIPLNLAKAYGAPAGMLAKADYCVAMLVLLKDGLTRKVLEGHIGQTIYTDVYTRRKVLAVREVPDEYMVQLKGEPGMLVIGGPLGS